MKIKITHSGIYSDFESVPGKSGAQELEAGDVVDYPVWYAESLVASGKAKRILRVGNVKAEVSATGTGAESIYFEEATGSDQPLVEQVEETILDNITSAARTLAVKYGLSDAEIRKIHGTGVGGRIITADVEKFVNG